MINLNYFMKNIGMDLLPMFIKQQWKMEKPQNAKSLLPCRNLAFVSAIFAAENKNNNL